MSNTDERKKIRSPICVVLGHIDHGKTSLLDKIRGTAVQAREAAGITQHIGASFFPTETIEKVCGELVKRFKIKLKIPGLMVIDTPGHAAFYNLRRRGGAVADIAILVVDINSGFQTQTYESIKILKSRKVPFIVAANKIDRIPGWKSNPDMLFFDSLKNQRAEVKAELDRRIYDIVGELSANGFDAERFDRVANFTKTIAIVPTSAKTGEGIPELLVVLAGLTQQYLTERLLITEGPAKGTILEVREEKGLGTTIDVIIYDGIIKKNDTIVVGGLGKTIVTKVRSLLIPKPLDEIRDPEDKFNSAEEVSAAAGVKISAPNLEDAVAGAPMYVALTDEDVEQLKQRVEKEIGEFRTITDKQGIILKTDTLGSLEAFAQFLREHKIAVRIADVGPVTKRDVMEAIAATEKDPYSAVILAFNVKVNPDARELAEQEGIEIFENSVIYQLYEAYNQWKILKREQELASSLDALIHPGKIQILSGYVFRKNNPAIVGIRVLKGVIKPKYPLIREDGKRIGTILQIRDRNENLDEARMGQEVAISIKGPTVGRHIKEEDILYVDVPESNVKTIQKKFIDELPPDEVEALEEFINIKRKHSEFFAM